jgi:hypothetical protein
MKFLKRAFDAIIAILTGYVPDPDNVSESWVAGHAESVYFDD